LPGPAADRDNAVRNLRAKTGCNCDYGVPPNVATARFAAATVAPDITVALAETGGSVSGAFAPDSSGRLSTTAAGVLTLTATFTLARFVAGGFAALRLPDAATPNLTAPAVVTAAVLDTTITLTYSGPVAANTAIEVDFWNGTGLYMDVQRGSLSATLDASTTATSTTVEAARAVGAHWVEVTTSGGSLLVEAGCSRWQGRREALGPGNDPQPLVDDLLTEHDRVAGCHDGTWQPVGDLAAALTLPKLPPTPKVTATPRTTTATWTVEPAIETNHYWSLVDCAHGHSQSGLWTVTGVVDDRNFVPMAQPAFANHLARFPDCDCTLQIGYVPIYTPTEV
jgi:hypothetical protein